MDKENIDNLIDDTLESVSSINAVNSPPFFKEKVLRRLEQQKVEETNGVVYLSWFTPKFQAAALICFVFLNVAALFTYSSDSYSEDVNSFAETYGLSETDSDDYLYQN